MLDFFRKKATSWTVKIILALIILAFAFWGTGRITSKKDIYVAQIGKHGISIYEFDRTLRNALEGLAQLTGRPVRFEEVKNLGIGNEVLKSLINSELLFHEASKWGLRTSAEELRYVIYNSPLFQRKGVFDRELYLTFLRKEGLTPPQFEEHLSKELLISRIQRTIGEIPHFSPSETQTIFSKLSTKLILEGVFVNAENLKGEITLKEEDLLSYYNEHKEEFKLPEKVKIAFVKCSPEEVLSQVSVDPKEVEKYYREHQEEFTLPERVKLGHIFLTDKKKAEEVLERLKKGEDFASLAKRFSEDPLTKGEGGLIGWVAPNDLNQELAQEISAMSPGEIKLYEGQKGVHIFKVFEKKPKSVLPFEEVKGPLTQKVQRKKASELCAMKMADVAYRAKKEGDLQKYAQKEGLKVYVQGPLGRTDLLEGMGKAPQVLETAFSLSPGEISPPIEEGGKSFVVQLLEKIPPRTASFEEVKETLKERVVQIKAMERAKQVAKEILNMWREGKDVNPILKKYNLKVETLKPVSRVEVFLSLSKEIGLLLPSDPVPSSELEVRGGYLALRLYKLEEPTQLELKGAREALENFFKGQLLQSFLNKKMEEEKVRFNPKLLQQYGIKLGGTK
jgi:peptidyl-prolyl cis-trans isomerase D